MENFGRQNPLEVHRRPHFPSNFQSIQGNVPNFGKSKIHKFINKLLKNSQRCIERNSQQFRMNMPHPQPHPTMPAIFPLVQVAAVFRIKHNSRGHIG